MTRTKHPGIYKRASTHGPVYDAWASCNGHQKVKRGFTLLAEARAWQEQTRQEMREGREVITSRLTYGDYLTKRWLPHKQASLKPGSASTYATLSKRVIAALGSTRLSSLSTFAIEEFMDGLTLSPNSRSIIYAIIRHSLRDARRWRLIAYNPCETIQQPAKINIHQTPALDRDSVLAIMRAAQPTPYSLMVHLAILTGMRLGELTALSWGAIDFGAGLLTIPHAKTRSGERAVALDAATVALLQTRYLEHIANYGDNYPPEVFPEFSEHRFREAWRTICIVAALPGLHFHDLRHAHATLLARAGVHLSVAQRRLGHANISMTADIYTHVDVSDQRLAAEAVAKFLADS